MVTRVDSTCRSPASRECLGPTLQPENDKSLGLCPPIFLMQQKIQPPGRKQEVGNVFALWAKVQFADDFLGQQAWSAVRPQD